jgi:dienelactone hydrolase
MATPTLTKTTIPGTLGEILVDVRAAERSAPAPAVIIVHGFKGFKDWGMFPPFADRVARAGFTAVSLNLSGSGVDDRGEFSFPERFGKNTFSAEQDDLDRVLAVLDSGGLGVPRPSRVGVVGHSRGGGAAVLYAARVARIAALVTWAAIATVRRWPEDQRQAWRARGRLDVVNARTGQVLPMGVEVLDDIDANGDTALDIEGAAGRIGVPWLLIHGAADEAVPVAEAERLAAIGKRRSDFERLIIEGAGHTFGAVHPFAGMTPHLEQVFDASVRRLTRSLS